MASCDVPFVIHPVGLHMRDMSKSQAIGAFEATEELYKCLVDPENLLIVDAWNPPPGGWLPIIADFIGVKRPPPESRCDVPASATHSVDCDDADKPCKACRQWMKEKNSWKKRNPHPIRH